MPTRSTTRHADVGTRRTLHAQRGVVLFIVLLVMVVMALAAAALVRSVDIGNLAAGNLSFKQSALSATDIGVEAAITGFRSGGALASSLTTEADIASQAYFATIQPTDTRGVPTALLNTGTFDAAHAGNCFWANATWSGSPKACTASPASTDLGQVRYLIDRQCTVEGPYNDAACNYIGQAGATGGSDNTTHTGVENAPVYRVTVRVDGPKNTVSFSQVVFRP